MLSDSNIEAFEDSFCLILLFFQGNKNACIRIKQ